MNSIAICPLSQKPNLCKNSNNVFRRMRKFLAPETNQAQRKLD